LIANKRKAPKDSPRLKALVKRVAELHRARLEACHIAEEFIFWQICPLDRKEKLALECLQFADPSRDRSDGKGFLILRFMLLTFPSSCEMMCCLSCLALSAEEVENNVRLMFDQPPIDRGSEVSALFSSDNPPPEVSHCSTHHWKLHDDIFFV
jgi:hypothetical protein